MSGRKLTLAAYKAISSGSMAGNITSAVTDITNLDNVAIQFNFSGTPTGSFDVQGSVDGTNFVSLSLSPTPAATGAAGNILINLTNLSFAKIRAVYNRTSGTGTLDMIISGKQA